MLTGPVHVLTYEYTYFQEICETHQLLLDNEEILAPDSDDPLHTLLSELGERPSVHALVGENIGKGLMASV